MMALPLFLAAGLLGELARWGREGLIFCGKLGGPAGGTVALNRLGLGVLLALSRFTVLAHVVEERLAFGGLEALGSLSLEASGVAICGTLISVHHQPNNYIVRQPKYRETELQTHTNPFPSPILASYISLPLLLRDRRNQNQFLANREAHLHLGDKGVCERDKVSPRFPPAPGGELTESAHDSAQVRQVPAVLTWCCRYSGFSC